MKNNPLIVQLATLTRKEMSRFSEFAASPYFNKHKQVQALVGYLSEIYPDFSERRCERETIFKRVFPGMAHQQSQLAIIFTYTLRLFEQFLIIEHLRVDGSLEDKTLYFSQLRKRKLTGHLKTDWETTPTRQNKSEAFPYSIPADFYEKKIRTATEQDAINMLLGGNETHFLEAKQMYLDEFYLTETLRDACERTQRYRLQKTTLPTSPFSEKMMGILDEFPRFLFPTPTISVYHKLYKLLKFSNLQEYAESKLAIQENERFFRQEELQSLYNYLQNFCIQQINNGHEQFLVEVFKLYQLQLERQLLIVDGVLPEFHFKNIVTTGLRLDERQWVRDFIEKYSIKLAENVSENAYSYNLAAWFYHVGKPSEVLPLLLQVEYTDLRYNLDAKSLLLRTYFDLEEEEALLAHAEAFSQFVKRNKALTDFQKKGYFNLIRLTQRTFKLKMQKEFTRQEKWQEAQQKLMQDMANTEPIFNRTWLESKVGELEI